AARGAIVDDMLYLSNLAVRPTHRRKGLAQGILNTLGDWGHAHGATAYVLQVAATNTAANTLYARRDFTESHRYRYWIPNNACEDHTLGRLSTLPAEWAEPASCSASKQHSVCQPPAPRQRTAHTSSPHW